MNVTRAIDARDRMAVLFAPRRERIRREVLAVLLLAEPRDAAARRESLAKVHDLCAKELAVRVRLAADLLRDAFRGGPAVAADRVFADVKAELEDVLREETRDLVDDELLAASLIQGVRRYALERLGPGATFGA